MKGKINLFKNILGGKKMNMKKLGLMALMATLITIGLAGLVHGATGTFVAPLDSGVIKGTTYIFNVSLTINDDTNITNCSLTGSSALTSDTLTAYMFNNSCGSGNGTCANVTIDTTTLIDAADWTFSATCYNVSNMSQSAGAAITFTPITLVTVDNTVPVVTLSTPTDKSKDTDGKVTFTYTCSNATSATLYLEDSGGYTQYTMTESSDSCTYDATILTNAFHSHYIIGSDGTNTTTSSVSTVEVRRPGGYIYDEQGNILDAQGNIMTDTAGATVPVKKGNVVTNMVNGIFDFIFGIFDSIFSAFKR